MLQWKFVEQLKTYLKIKQRNEKYSSILTCTISKFFFAVFSHLGYVVTELRFKKKKKKKPQITYIPGAINSQVQM